MDNRYEVLHRAVSEIAARCDGAVSQDGVGFNGQDTKFGRRVSAMPVDTWNDTVAAEVARILPTYHNQLESYGIDYNELKSVISTFDDNLYSRHDARDIARQAEYAAKHAPYIAFDGNIVQVFNSYPIKDELKRNGFRFDPRLLRNKAWESPLNGQAASTIIALGIKVTDEQKAILDAQEIIPTEPGQLPEARPNIEICSLHPDHLQLETEWGQIPLAIIRAIPGRKWDGSRKVNCISPHIGLYALAEEFKLTISGKARELIESYREAQEAEQAVKKMAMAESFATDTDKSVAIQDNLYPFQRAGSAYAIDHGNTLIGDEMGLGKTRQALSVLETKNAYPALIVCPPKLTLNWLREIHALLPHRTVSVYQGKRNGGWLPESDIHVMGYSVVDTYADALPELSGMVLDESHYVKNEKAGRTRAILEISGHGFIEEKINGKKVRHPLPGRMSPNPTILELTGTSVLNRPIELVQQLIVLGRLNVFGNGEGSVKWFKNRFCGPEWNGWGTTYNGATNLEELHMWLRQTCYVRREKKDVLKELPAKTRAPQFIDLDDRSRRLYMKLAEEGAEKAAESRAEALVYMNALRHAVGTAKTDTAVEWADDFLDSTDKSLIIFANHRDVQKGIIDGLREKGYEVLTILGGANNTATEEAKRAFQAKEARVIVLSLMGAKEGHTLTAASDVLLVEQGWNPGTQDQAEDRAHRIGQDYPVTAWYIIAQDTIDEWLYEIVQNKRSIVNMVNRGMTDIEVEESVFNEVLEKALNTYGGRTRY